MSAKPLPSPELLRQLLSYEPETGELFWRARGVGFFSDGAKSAHHSCNAWNSRFANKAAFTSYDGNGYLHGRVLRSAYQAHRVTWAIYNGQWPEQFIDHINGIRDDNRISNLRCASVTDNNRNMRISVRNNSGYVGVFWSKVANKWGTTICDNGQPVHLGYFTDKNDAIVARKEAELKYGYHPNHGNAKIG